MLAFAPELVESETVLVAAATAEVLGSGSKLTVAVKLTSWDGHWPEDPVPPEPEELALELCSVTSWTPSIRCRRSSISATDGWLIAQPVRANVGTLPAGVAEATLELAAAVLELLPDVVLLDVVLVGLGETGVEPVLPTVPLSEEIEVAGGITRPNSCRTWAQSKRESTSESTACVRCSRIAMKLAYGASFSAAACVW